MLVPDKEIAMKKGTRRFHLNRETLRNLDAGGLKIVAGGAPTANPTVCNPNSDCIGCPSLPVRTCPSVLCN